MPLKLYERVKNSLSYQHQKDITDITDFVDKLPKTLQVQVSMFVYERLYRKINFLQDRTSSFISWICPHLRPMFNAESEYVFFEGDEITSLYFLNEGECGFVLPRHNNLMYIRFHQGCDFGNLDIAGSILKYDINFEEWM